MKKKAIKLPFRVAVTGHRKFSNIKKHDEWETSFYDAVSRFVLTARGSGISKGRLVFLSGCALGVDIWFANFARNNGIAYELYLPFKRTIQVVKGRFTPLQIDNLNQLILDADKVVVVNRKFYPYGYQVRNQALVDNSNLLLTYYQRARSGSGNCVRYAKKVNRWTVDLMRFDFEKELPFCLEELVI